MILTSEEKEKYFADAFYESAIELVQRGRFDRAKEFFVAAYSLYVKIEDLEGINKCRDAVNFNRVEEIAFNTGRIISKKLEKIIAFPDFSTKEEITSILRKTILEIVFRQAPNF